MKTTAKIIAYVTRLYQFPISHIKHSSVYPASRFILYLLFQLFKGFSCHFVFSGYDILLIKNLLPLPFRYLTDFRVVG